MRRTPSAKGRISTIGLAGMVIIVLATLFVIIGVSYATAAKSIAPTGTSVLTRSKTGMTKPTPTRRRAMVTPVTKVNPVTQGTPTPKGTPSQSNEPVQITGRAIWGDYEKKITFIAGDIRIVQGKTIITTEKAEINTEKKTAVFSNGVQLSHPDVTITADHLEYDLKRKTGTFRRQVTLNRIENKDDGGKTNRDPFTLTADQLYFESDTKNFKAAGQSRIKHKDFTGQADTIEYQDQEQKMIFLGAVEIVQDTTTIRAQTLELDLKQKRLIIPEQAESSDQDVTIVGGELIYDYEHKIGTFKKQVVLNRLNIKDSKQKTKKDPFKLMADELSFDSETNNFVARGNGTLEHKEFTGTAELIEYNDETQTLIFEGNAVLKRPKGESIKGKWIRINLEEETFTVRTNAVTELQVDSKD